MKRKVTTSNVASIEKKAKGDLAASEKATPSPTKAKPRRTPADKLDKRDSLQSGPTAMDLLNIACMYELIPQPELGAEHLGAENMTDGIYGLVMLDKDKQFCSHLEEAAHIYRLAEAVAHKAQQAGLLDIKVTRRNLLRVDQFRQIWAYACRERKKYLPLEQAMKALHFRSEDSFRQFMRTFFCVVGVDDKISLEAIRVLKILQAEQNRKKEAERKRLRRASKRQNNAQSASPQQEANVDPDIVYSNLLKSLHAAFQQARVQVDASLFFEIMISDF